MRYLPLADSDKKEMMSDIGVKDVAELFVDVPNQGKVKSFPALDEIALEKEIGDIAAKNVTAADHPCFLGAGVYRHYVPAVVDYMVQRGEFLTSYTPYQPEVSQGTLQILFEYQTQVARLFDMDIANASLYDGATACFEAAAMACRYTKRNKIIVSGGVHPEFAEVTKSCTQFGGVEVKVLSPLVTGAENIEVDESVAGVIVQVPTFFGEINDYAKLAEKCHAVGALLIIATTEPLALGLIKSFGKMGADIALGEGMSLAGHLNFGGPTLGLFAVKHELMRAMPGRLVGETVDVDGKRGFVLTMATREQHIRREKATSNICTNAGIMAAAFSMHMTMLGEKGFKDLAWLNYTKAVKLAAAIEKIEGVKVVSKTFFNEFTIRLEGQSAKAVVSSLFAAGVLGGVPVSRFYKGAEMNDLLLVAVTEMVSDDDMHAFIQELSK